LFGYIPRNVRELRRSFPSIASSLPDSLEQPKPIDDADLVKAIDITFKRLGAYPRKAEAAPAPVQNNYLYRPQWLQVAR
jgi:hypothetical protein